MHNEVLESLIVVKRSGQRVSFNASKVALAIKKAYDSINENDESKSFKTFEKVLTYINDNYKDRKTINVEEIQDIIEQTLYKEKNYDIYNSFKEYREKRALSRKLFAEKQQHKFIKAIEKIEETREDENNNQNAESIIYDFGKIISSEYTKSYILDTKSLRFLEEGIIHIHPLEYFSLGMFSNVNLIINKKCDVELKITNIISMILNAQREVNDEIGLNNIDYVLESYFLHIYKRKFKEAIASYFKLVGLKEFINIKRIEDQIDKENNTIIDIKNYEPLLLNEVATRTFNMAYEDSKKYMTSFIPETISRIFYSIEEGCHCIKCYSVSFGLNSSSIGKQINNAIINNFATNQYKNIKIIYKLDKLEFENSSKLLEAFEKNNSIYLLFTSNEKLDYFTDGIKIFNNANNNENFSNGRVVVGTTSINLARIGLKYKNRPIEKFYDELNNTLEQIKNELLLCFESIGNKQVENYKTLFIGNIYDDEKLEPGQKIRKVLKNGILNIGLIGLCECVKCLEDNSERQEKLALNIIDNINKKSEEYSSDTKLNFGTYEPIDNISRCRLLSIDKSIYGNVPGINDKKKYDLIDLNFVNDYKSLAKFQSKFTNGKLITINVSGKLNMKKLADLIESLKEDGIEFVKLTTEK